MIDDRREREREGAKETGEFCRHIGANVMDISYVFFFWFNYTEILVNGI